MESPVAYSCRLYRQLWTGGGWAGNPSGARAAGAAIGANPISFLIPCHRAIAKDGRLTGYHWGLERKVAMLGAEAVGRWGGVAA